MKPWIKRTLIGLTGLTIVLGGMTACGARHYEQRYGGEWTPERFAEVKTKVVDRISKKLDLTEPQRQKLAALGDAIETQRNAARAKGSVAPREAVKALIAGDKFDREGAQALVTQKTQAVQEASPAIITALADFYDSLTPTQQAEVREHLAKRRGHWGRWGSEERS